MLSGCTARTEPPSPAEEAEATRALSLLGAADDSTLTHAFAQVSARAHTRFSRIWQQIGQRPPATVMRVVRQGLGRDAVIVSEGRTGSFAKGFTGAPTNLLRVDSLAEHLVEKDPAHLSTRFAEDFIYRILLDTVMWNRPVQVIAIEARPNSAQSVKEARYYLDQGVLTAFYWVQVRQSLFFSENTRYFLQIRPDAHGAWVPHHIHMSTNLAFPLRPARRLGQSATVYDYREAVPK